MTEERERRFGIEPVITEHVEVTHYLCSVMAQGEPTDPQAFAAGMAKALGEQGVVPIMSTAYMSRYGVDPVKSGLKDQWLQMAPGLEREDFMHNWPELGRALDLLCGVTKKDLEKETSP